MLNHRFNACNATNHSPEKEQRLLSFAQEDEKKDAEKMQAQTNGGQESDPTVQNEKQYIRNEMLAQGLPLNPDIPRLSNEKLPDTLLPDIEAVRMNTLEQVRNKVVRIPNGPEFHFNTGADFEKHFLIAKIYEKLESSPNEHSALLRGYLGQESVAKIEELAFTYGVDSLPAVSLEQQSNSETYKTYLIGLLEQKFGKKLVDETDVHTRSIRALEIVCAQHELPIDPTQYPAEVKKAYETYKTKFIWSMGQAPGRMRAYIIEKIASESDDHLNQLKEMYQVHMPKNSPPAFIRGDEMYFDASRPEFTDTTTRERNILHELTHYELDIRSKDERFAEKGVQLLKESPQWNEMKQAVTESYDGSFSGSDEDFVHELLATYVAGKRHAYDESDRRRRMMEILENERVSRPDVDEWMKRVETGVNTYFEDIRVPFEAAVYEKEAQKKVLDAIEESHVRDTAALTVRSSNTPDLKREYSAEDKATEKEAEEEDENWIEYTPEAVNKLKGDLKDMSDTLHKIHGYIPEAQKTASKIPDPKDRATHNLSINLAANFITGNIETMKGLQKFLSDLLVWDTLTPQEKEAYNKRWNMNLDIIENRSKILSSITSTMNSIEDGPIKEMEEYLSKAVAPVDKGRKMGKSSMFVWHPLSDLPDIAMKLIEAYKESYKADKSRRVFQTASSLSPAFRYIPYGKSVYETLSKQAKAANDEESNKFLDYMKSKGFTYDEIFGRGKFLARNINNVNRAKAIIEYGASKGWLYEMNEKNGHNVYGLDYQTHFSEQAFIKLIDMNAKGKKDEIDRGYNRVNFHPEIPLIIDDIKDELSKRNIYAVQGMLKRLQEKAKIGECNTWGLTTVLRALREDSELLELVDTGFLDSTGNIGMAQAGWSLALLKTQRKQILAWKKAGGTLSALKSTKDFSLGAAIARIEELMPADVRANTSKLDREVAKVLSGYTRHGISIFRQDPAFIEYRKFWKNTTNSTPIEVGKTDPDFFNPSEDTYSDVLLLSQGPTSAILARQSQGYWTHDEKARGYMTMVLQRYDNLIKDGLSEEEEVFQKEMKAKLQYWYRKVISQAAGLKNFVTDTTLDDKIIFEELYARGIMDKAEYNTFKFEAQKDPDDVKEVARLRKEEEKARKAAEAAAAGSQPSISA